jgi:hypothetical protein
MMTSFTIEKAVHFERHAHGRQELLAGNDSSVVPEARARVPRVARLLALAIRFEGLLRSGQIRDQAELARLGQVTRARVSQILSLIHLAPDIQEEILFLQGGRRGDDLLLADLLPIAAMVDWAGQRRRWRTLRRYRGAGRTGPEPGVQTNPGG